MNNTDKVAQLRQLDEATLRQTLLVPLLGRMGYRAATEYHGSRELGKDIVCFDDHKLGGRKYLAIVAKVGDLTGSVSSASGLSEVLNQVEQCFNETYRDLFGMRAVTMDEVWVVTTGRIVTGAGDTVAGRLEKHNLAKLVHFVSGEQLVHLIDEHYQSYWNEGGETIERVRDQRDSLRRFLHELLRKLGATDAQVEEVAKPLLHSSWAPLIRDLNEMRLRHVSSYEITVGPSSYPKGLASDQCGDIARALKDAQDKVRSALYDVEDVLETAHKAIAQSDPWEFVRLFQKIEREDPFHNARFGAAADAVSEVSALVDGLRELDAALDALGEAGKRDYFLTLVASIESLRDEVDRYLRHVDSETFSLNWSVGGEPDPRVRIVYDGPAEAGREAFTTTHHRDVKLSYRSDATRRVTAGEVLERAQMELRETIEKRFCRETRAATCRSAAVADAAEAANKEERSLAGRAPEN